MQLKINPLAAIIAWASVIFATSCTFIDRRVFIQFVGRFIPNGVPQRLWIEFWNSFGLVVVKSYHVMEYALLCTLAYCALRNRAKWSPTRTLCMAAAASILYAASDEWHQTFVPGRGGTWVDVVIDSLGVCMASVLIATRLRRANAVRNDRDLTEAAVRNS